MSEDLEQINRLIAKEEDQQNLVGLFSILLEVDKRINPQNYKLTKQTNEQQKRN